MEDKEQALQLEHCKGKHDDRNDRVHGCPLCVHYHGQVAK